MSDTNRTLNMKFKTELGTTARVAIRNCKPDLDEQGVRGVMSALVGEDVFSFGAASAEGAEIVERKTTELF